MSEPLYKRIKDWIVTITKFRSGDVIPVDGPSGTAKMSKDDLLRENAQNTLAGNVAPAFDPTRDSSNKYIAGKNVVAFNGKINVFRNDHYGDWDASDVSDVDVFEDLITLGSFAIVENSYYPSNSNSATYSNDYDTLARIPVKVGDVVRVNVGLLGCRVVIFQADDSVYDYFSVTSGAERSFIVGSIAGKTPKYFNVPIHKANRASCFVYVNGKCVYDGSSDSPSALVSRIHNAALQNLYFEGNGNTFAYKLFYNKLIPGKRYRLHFLTSGANYADTGSDPIAYKLLIRAIDDNGSTIRDLVVVYQGSAVSKTYEFDMPSNGSTIRFGGRIAAGKVVIAIPEEINLQDYLNKDSFRPHVVFSKNFLQSSTSSGYPANDGATNRVCGKDIVLWPHGKGTYRFVAPSGVQFSAALFTALQNYSSALSWTSSGGTFTINPDSDGKYGYRPSFRRSDNSDISVADVLEYIESGKMYIEELDSSDVDYKLHPALTAAASAKKKLVGSSPWLKMLPTFAHVSDLHGDVTRHHNARNIAEVFGVDALVNSGDSVMLYNTSGAAFTGDDSDVNIPEIFCIGNHEAYPTGDTQLFTKFVQPLVTANGYEKSSGTSADDCYYFRDFAAKKIRLVVLNYYDGGVYAGSLGKDQLEWFVDTLENTPEGYGVVVVVHSPEDKIVCPEELQTFYQKERVVSYQENGFYVGDRPIMNIVDAFISGTSGTESYTDNGTSVSVTYDFTSLATGVEFICYMCGHRHEDWVGYYDHSTNMQLSLGIVTGNALNSMFDNTAWNNQSDLGRNDGRGIPQDAVNIYAIDRDAGKIRVVRVGADFTTSLERRDVLVIPYRQE